jgi:ketosteroid isomerase-like protein
MSRNETNIEATQRLFAAFGKGDIPAILDLLDDDVVIEFYGPSVIPYAGSYRGLHEARSFFETVLASVDIHEFVPQEFLADADKVVVTGHLRLSARSTGRAIESDFVHVITMRDGKWLRFRDFMNTARAAAAFSA